MILAGRSIEGASARLGQRNPPSGEGTAQGEEDPLNTSVSSDDMNRFRLEVLQRLTEDRLRDVPQEGRLEMEDDDPISQARQHPNPSPREKQGEGPPEASVQDPGIEMLSPIREMTETYSSATSNPNSAPSTAPSTPCSPLDVAPFMPSFFTTSPANSLDRRKMGSFEDWGDRESLHMEGGSEETDTFSTKPLTSDTPRFQTRTGVKEPYVVSTQSKSFENLARGSYTVDHVPVEAARAAGIPVICQVGNTLEASHSQTHFDGLVNTARNLPHKNEPIGFSDSAGFSSNSPFVNKDSPPIQGDQRPDSLEITPPVSSHALASSAPQGLVSSTKSVPEFSSPFHARPHDSPREDVIYERTSRRMAPEGGHVTESVGGGQEQFGAHARQNTADQFDFSAGAVRNFDQSQENNYSTFTKKKINSARETENENPDLGKSTFRKGSGFLQQHQVEAAQRPRSPESQSQRAVDNGVHEIDGRGLDLRPSGDCHETFDRYATYRKVIQPSGRSLGDNGRSLADTGRELPDSARRLANSSRGSVDSGRGLADISRTSADSSRTLPDSRRKLADGGEGVDQFGTYRKATKATEVHQGNLQEGSYSETQNPEEERRLAKSEQGENRDNQRVEESYQSPKSTAFTFDLNSDSLQELHRSGTPNKQAQNSPSSLIRSRTFRKKPNGQIIADDIPIEPEHVSTAPSGTTSPRPSSLPNHVSSTPPPPNSPANRETGTPRRISPVGDRGNSSAIRTSWSEEARASFPEGAEMKVVFSIDVLLHNLV